MEKKEALRQVECYLGLDEPIESMLVMYCQHELPDLLILACQGAIDEGLFEEASHIIDIFQTCCPSDNLFMSTMTSTSQDIAFNHVCQELVRSLEYANVDPMLLLYETRLPNNMLAIKPNAKQIMESALPLLSVYRSIVEYYCKLHGEVFSWNICGDYLAKVYLSYSGFDVSNLFTFECDETIG